MDKFKCSHCKVFKERNDVVKYAVSSNGNQLYYCNICNTEKMKKYYKTKYGKSRVKLSNKRSQEKYQYKQSARIKINEAVRSGKAKKPNTCSVCLKTVSRIEAHHLNYNEPLNVVWVCTKCHSILDRYQRLCQYGVGIIDNGIINT